MPKAIILMYHNIDVPPKGVRIPNLYVTPRMFRFQMAYLKWAGFKVVPLEDLLAVVEAGELRRSLAAITFDDGFTDFFTNAYPLLKTIGYPSTVYIVSGRVSTWNEWDARIEVRKPLMDWSAILDASRNGVRIGSHTKTHPRLTALPPEALREELTGSKRALEERLNRPVEHFCYPYGDYNDAVREEVRKTGYRYAVDTRRGHVERGCDYFALPRIPVKLITNPVSFFYKLHTDSEKRKGRQGRQQTLQHE